MHPTVMRLHAGHADDNRITTALAEFAAETFPLAAPADTPAEAIAAHVAKHFTPEAFRGHLRSQQTHVWLLGCSGTETDDSSIVGYALVVEDRLPNDPNVHLPRTQATCMLSKFYLSPRWHGAGTAKTFMDRVLADMREQGSTSMWLTVNNQNAKATRFYAKRGFTQIGIQEFVVGTDHLECDFVLYRDLDER